MATVPFTVPDDYIPESQFSGLWPTGAASFTTKNSEPHMIWMNPRPKQVIINDIYPQGEPMKLFTFATTKPPAATIWKTLMESDIKPSDGLSVMHIRYLIFYYLQTNPDFEVAKSQINTKLNAHREPGTWNNLGVVISDLRKVTTDIPDHFPNWIGDDLYVPYYMAKQLGHSIVFDRETISDLEDEHLRIDAETRGTRWTAYSMWLDITDPLWFLKINMSLPPVTVVDHDHFIDILRAEISRIINDNDGIIDTTKPTTIPPFILGVPDEA